MPISLMMVRKRLTEEGDANQPDDGSETPDDGSEAPAEEGDANPPDDGAEAPDDGSEAPAEEGDAISLTMVRKRLRKKVMPISLMTALKRLRKKVMPINLMTAQSVPMMAPTHQTIVSSYPLRRPDGIAPDDTSGTPPEEGWFR